MSSIRDQNNLRPPLQVYHAWGRWRLVKTEHVDTRKEVTREQYTLQRYSDSKSKGKTWHMVAFFWSLEDFDDWLSELNKSGDLIEELDGDRTLKRGGTSNGTEERQ